MTCLLALALYVASVVLAIDYRKEEFDRIKKYELVNVDFTPETQQIHFDAFGNEYSIDLVTNHHLNPSSIHHTNGNLALDDETEPFYSHLTESCHYHGKVFGAANGSSVAISVCDKRGIRGTITAFGDTINIKPAKYFDGEYDRNNYHHHADEHLVYKLVDFEESDESNQYKGRGVQPHDTVSGSQSPHRRRMSQSTPSPYNNGNNVLKVYSFVDPYYYSTYVSEYSSLNWYDVMVAELADLWNGVSEQFSNPKFCSCPKEETERCHTDAGDRNCYYAPWSDRLSGISIKWVALEVAVSWTGKYAGLKPETHIDENGKLKIGGSKYLGKFRSWIAANYYANGNRPDFDQATKFTGHNPEDGAQYDSGGWAYKRTICKTAGLSSAAILRRAWSYSEHVSLTAHELGHNFGSDHDASTWGVYHNDCHKDSGNMGYGLATSGWSECSRDYINKYFADMNGLSCLAAKSPIPFETQIAGQKLIARYSNNPDGGWYSHLGCYKDAWDRAMEYHGANGIKTIEGCYDVCIGKGYSLFGLQYPGAGQCFCSNDKNKAIRYGKVDNCNDGRGGTWAMDIYRVKTECYMQGGCVDGYMDKTNGNANWWACGVDCPGGKHLTDGACHCACIPDFTNCNRFGFSSEFSVGISTSVGLSTSVGISTRGRLLAIERVKMNSTTDYTV